jgi:glutathione synthase/RimK-type ligase-like ATP-grasp enzyme
MADWVILVDTAKDFPNADTPHKVITTKDYLARASLFRGSRPKIINLSRSFAYQSRGYYASLLAEARGHRIIPSVETMVDLGARQLYAQALPELDDALLKAQAAADDKTVPSRLLVYFGTASDRRFDRFGRLLFDWYRCPVLEVTIETDDGRPEIRKLASVPITKLSASELARFHEAMHQHTTREWRSKKDRATPRYSFAVLFDPNEKMPPSDLPTLKHWSRIAEKQGVEIEPITRRDLARLAEFDALFIRETTSIDNHTYRFARRAVQEGMPVIDDPISMIRCTNKIYLHELMISNGIAVPPTVILGGMHDLARAGDELGFPMVLKVPDSSFSRGVKKVDSAAELSALAKEWFEDTDLLLAQAFMPTSFDWRVGVLGGKPIFACQYMMAKKHWQVVKHRANGSPLEGAHNTIPLSEAPPAVIDVGLRAAQLIGNGLYGVDIKETPDGIHVVEVNDNPNIDHGIEDAAEKDQVWIELTRWFTDRLDG